MPGLSIPNFQIPISHSVVGVSIIDTTVRVKVPTLNFVEEQIPGYTHLDAPAWSFLLEHGPSGQKLVFDLGWRPDYENLPPDVVNPLLEQAELGTVSWSIENDVATILENGGVPREDIDAVIISHTHIDHIGDPSTFPNSTTLVVGPGFTDTFVPGYPANPNGLILQSDYEGRELHEIDFDASPLKIGRFQAFDYFGDGSFYLLHSPGHAIGHLNALARTTHNTFILLGADTCPQGGSLRPSPYLPLPRVLRPSPFSDPPFQPGSSVRGQKIIDELHPYHAGDEPFFQSYVDAWDRNTTDIVDTVGKVIEFDARDDVFVIIAHDKHLGDVVKLFPEKANAWKRKGWKDQARWRFLEEYGLGQS